MAWVMQSPREKHGGFMALATRRSALIVVTAALILWLAAQASAAAGEIVGCVTDVTGQKLPGVTIVAKAWGVQHTIPANAGGCYELTDLPPNSYRVTARLPGFDNVTRENVRIVPGQRLRLDFEMLVSALCDCLGFPPTLGALWDHSDAVLHVTLTDHEAQLPAPPGYFTHTAVVLDAFKQPQLEGALVGSTGTVLEEQRNGVPGPYDVGQ